MEFVSLQTLLTWIGVGIASFFGAYLAAKGKNLARKEDLNALVVEVRAVTVTQKEIEAKISGEMWERQWRLNQKRDVYARLLESMSELRLNVAVVSKFLRMKPTEHLSDEVRKHGDRAAHVAQELDRAMAVAKIYLPPSAIASFRDLEMELQKLSPELEYSAVCLALGRAQEGLTLAAKVDLGIETAVPPLQSA
jgi:hypothetical protein